MCFQYENYYKTRHVILNYSTDLNVRVILLNVCVSGGGMEITVINEPPERFTEPVYILWPAGGVPALCLCRDRQG